MAHDDPWLRELRDARARVRQRWQRALSQAHAPEPGASESGRPPQVPWARQHPRWAPLLGTDRTRDAEALANSMASVQLANDGDVQHRRDELEDRDAVPVDYHQCYLDSGLRDLPASWVQNPGLETRFVEYVQWLEDRHTNTAGTPASTACSRPSAKWWSAWRRQRRICEPTCGRRCRTPSIKARLSACMTYCLSSTTS